MDKCPHGKRRQDPQNSYRLHIAAVEITKVGKVLMSIDSGVLPKGASSLNTALKTKGYHIPHLKCTRNSIQIFKSLQ